MSGCTVLAAGMSFEVVAGVEIPAGRWEVRAAVPGSAWVWVTVRASGSAVPLVPGKSDGTLSLDVPPGEILITWNGAPGTGRTNRVVVKSVLLISAPRPRATVGVIVQHGASKRIDADRQLAPRAPALRFVTSDFDAVTGKLQMTVPNASPERAEIGWLRQANPSAYIVACCMNLWNGRSYRDIAPSDARAWAWLALDTWADQVDCVLGPNEADTAKYNGDIRTRGADALKHLHELWAEAAQVFRAAGLPTGGPAHLKPDSMRTWERDFGALTNVVTCHGYMDRRAGFAREMRSLADRKGGMVVIDEIAPAAVLTNGTLDRAATDQACAKLLQEWSPWCDVLLHYTGRSDAGEMQFDYVSLLGPDGSARPLASTLQPVFDASTRRARTTMSIDTAVLLAIAETRRAEGLPALRPSARLASIARGIASRLAEAGKDRTLDADFLRSASASTTTNTDQAPSIGGVSIATRLSAAIIREDATAWAQSPAHRPVLMRTGATEVGVAVTIGTSRYGGMNIPTAYFWACVG
jgi:uncharacterized protein YkwD